MQRLPNRIAKKEDRLSMVGNYIGKIVRGDRFLWEVEPHVFAHVVVVAIKDDGSEPTSICTLNDKGETRWVDETRFRKGCFWVGKLESDPSAGGE